MKAVDILQKMADQVNSLTEQIKIIDRNVKELMNQDKQIQVTANTQIAARPQVKIKSIEEDDLYKFKTSTNEVVRQKTIKVYGYVKRKAGLPLKDVQVTVFNGKDEEVLIKVTNKNGFWDGRLPVGKYVAEYKKQGLRAVNKIIEIDPDMEELEVI